MLKRALFAFTSLLIILSSLFVVVAPVKAQEDQVNEILKEFNLRRSGDQMNLETWYSGKVTDDPTDPASIGFADIVLLDLYSRMQGGKDINFTNPIEALQQLLSDANENIFLPLTKNYNLSNGPLAAMGGLIGATYKSPPVSMTQYVASVRENISKHGVVQPAYAQGAGYGFSNLLPVLPIWKAFRNVAYFVFILVFVLYGFMIMFRMKINPQNVATFQTAIPKIVTTLLVITFAYAIAGFMIDIMFLVFNLILSIFEASGLISNPDNWLVKMGSGQWGIGFSMLISLTTSLIFVPSRLISVIFNLPTVVGGLADLLLSVSGLGLIARVIIIIALLYSYVKLIFKLFEAYITVIIQVIFSPIILLQDVLPGSQAFGNWVRNIMANLSVFPVSMVMFLLSYIFMIQPLAPGILGATGVERLIPDGTQGLSLPLIGAGGLTAGWTIPFTSISLGGVDGSAILVVVGFFIILMASKYVDMVRDALKVPPFKYGSAIGEALQFGYQTEQGSLAQRIRGRVLPDPVNRAYGWGAEALGKVEGASKGLKKRDKQQTVFTEPAPTTTPPTSRYTP